MLDDHHLDALLDSAIPLTTRQTPELTHELFEVSRGAEAQIRRPQRSRRRLVAAVALTGVVGLGGAAAAGGLMPTWMPWTTRSGAECTMLYSVDPADAPEARLTQDAPRPIYDDPATVEANAYLARYDVDAIDLNAAVDGFAQEIRADQTAMPADQRPPAPDTTSDEFETQAVAHLVDSQLAAHLTAVGFDPDSVVLHSTFSCAR